MRVAVELLFIFRILSGQLFVRSRWSHAENFHNGEVRGGRQTDRIQ